MYALLTLDVARDAVADQFQLRRAARARRDAGPRRAPRAPASLLSDALHRAADRLAPAALQPGPLTLAGTRSS